MSDVNYRAMFPGEGFANMEFFNSVAPGWKRVGVITLGGSALINLKVKGLNACSQLIVVGALSDSNGEITCLANHGPYPSLTRPKLRLTKGGDLSDGTLGFEVSYGENVDVLVEWTDLSEDRPIALMTPTTPIAGTTTVAELILGNGGVQTTGAFKAGANEYFHLGNLPPISSAQQVKEGTRNDLFVTPASLKSTFDSINEGGFNVLANNTQKLMALNHNVILAHGEYELPTGGDADLTVRVGRSVDLTANEVGILAPSGKTISSGGEDYNRVRLLGNDVEYRFLRINGEWFV